MKNPLFVGAGVAIVTPFNQDKSVNYNKLQELIEFQIKENTDAIIICGTTGEASTLSENEYQDVINFTVEKVNGRIPVIAGTGSNNTQHAISKSQYAQKVGCDGVLVVSPYYNKTSQQGLYTHFKTIAQSVSVPVMLYNVPTRTGINIEPQTIFELSKISNINSVKECNLNQMLDVTSLCGDNFNIYTGNGNQTLPCLSYGGKGVVSVMGNVIPSDMHKMVSAFFDGNIQKAIELQIKTNKLYKGIFCDVSPIPIKSAMNLLGMDVGDCRLPLINLSQSNLKLLTNTLKDYGLLK